MFDRVVSEVGKIANNMTLGNGIDAAMQMGPLVSQEQLDGGCSYIDVGRAAGAEVVAGGSRQAGPGYFVRPTVLANVNQDARVVQEEIFGPVLTAMPYDPIEEVVAWANDSPYKLGASIWSNNLSKVHRLIPKIRREPSGSTATAHSILRCLSAATSSQAWAATWDAARSMPIWKPSPCSLPSDWTGALIPQRPALRGLKARPMSDNALQFFLQARQFLLNHRTDYDTAYEGFTSSMR